LALIAVTTNLFGIDYFNFVRVEVREVMGLAPINKGLLTLLLLKIRAALRARLSTFLFFRSLLQIHRTLFPPAEIQKAFCNAKSFCIAKRFPGDSAILLKIIRGQF
jgi:hypothetical protein